MRKSFFLAALIAFGVVAAPAAAQTPENLETLTIRYQTSAGSQVSYPELADALGYLAPLKLERVGVVSGGPAGIQATATNQTEFGQSFNGAIINAVAAGAPVKAVIGYHGTNGDDYFGGWVLEGSPIKTARDLIGKKIGVNTLGAAANAYIDEFLIRGGLTPDERKEVLLVPLPQNTIEQALRQKQIDAGILNSGQQDQAIERGGITLLFSDFEMFGEFTSASIVLKNSFIEENPNTTKHFVGAVAKAIAWSQEHTRDEVIDVYTKYLEATGQSGQIPALKYWRTQAVANKGGVISESEFSQWINWQEGIGQIKPGQIKASDIYTNAFNPFATASN